MNPYQTIIINDNYKIAHQLLDYNNFDALLNSIKNSSYSIEELSKIKNDQRKFEWLSVRNLLINLGFKSHDIRYDLHRKPSLTNSKFHISISHSKNRIAIGINEQETIGIDIQKISTGINSIKNKFLSTTELSRLDGSNSLTLTRAWSSKEAIFKANGKKDIYLKENIEIENIVESKNTTIIAAKFKDDFKSKYYKVNTTVIEDYVLAYTLND